mgnify:CR=1 FL=1
MFPTIILVVIAIAGLLLFGIILSFFSVWLRAWLAGAYRPVPTIVEAATMLYARNGVAAIATAVAQEAYESNLATAPRPKDLAAHVRATEERLDAAGSTFTLLTPAG